MSTQIKINDHKHSVILFIPEIGIYPYARGLAVLGDAIIKQGGKVLITHDTGQMLRSPIMAMYNTSVDLTKREKNKIRKVTEKYYKNILNKYKFSSIELSGIVDGQLNKEITLLINKIHGDLRNVTFRDFPVGKMAEFDFILETKFPYYPNLSAQHKRLYMQYIKNTALALAITDKICEIYKPSLFLTFNEYAQCQAVKYSATKHGIKHLALTYPVHFDIDASRFSIWKSTNRLWMSDHCQKWNDEKNSPIGEIEMLASWKDSVFRMYSSGSHIFSTKKNCDPGIIFKSLKLNPNKKTIVVYTSSQDERKCSEISMKIWKEDDHTVDSFSNQIEWLTMLQDYVSKRNDVQAVVRIHPREGVRQLGFSSQHLALLKNKFHKESPNFTMIWPNDPISSYDLMEFADVCLVAWSTIGQEAARLGIPVLSYISGIYYPNDDFIQVANNKKEYKNKLDSILQKKYTWQYLLKAARFYNWRTFIPSLDLSKFIPADFDDRSIWPSVPLSSAKTINEILSGKQDLIEYNIKKWKKDLPKNALAQETKAMKKGIRYFLDKIYYPPRNYGMLPRIWRYTIRKITGNSLWTPPSQNYFKDYNLKYSEEISKLEDFVRDTKKNSKLRVLVADDRQAILIHRGRLLKRMSPVAIRLAKLHENN